MSEENAVETTEKKDDNDFVVTGNETVDGIIAWVIIGAVLWGLWTAGVWFLGGSTNYEEVIVGEWQCDEVSNIGQNKYYAEYRSDKTFKLEYNNGSTSSGDYIVDGDTLIENNDEKYKKELDLIDDDTVRIRLEFVSNTVWDHGLKKMTTKTLKYKARCVRKPT